MKNEVKNVEVVKEYKLKQKMEQLQNKLFALERELSQAGSWATDKRVSLYSALENQERDKKEFARCEELLKKYQQAIGKVEAIKDVATVSGNVQTYYNQLLYWLNYEAQQVKECLPRLYEAMEKRKDEIKRLEDELKKAEAKYNDVQKKSRKLRLN